MTAGDLQEMDMEEDVLIKAAFAFVQFCHGVVESSVEDFVSEPNAGYVGLREHKLDVQHVSMAWVHNIMRLHSRASIWASNAT